MNEGPAERLRQCVVVLQMATPHGSDIFDPDWAMVPWLARNELIAQLDEIAEQLELGAQAGTAAPTVALCAAKPRTGWQWTCDRPEGHSREHSWEVDRIRRLAGEAEHEARRVPGLVREAQRLSAQLKRTERELELERLSWRARWRERAERREAERG